MIFHLLISFKDHFQWSIYIKNEFIFFIMCPVWEQILILIIQTLDATLLTDNINKIILTKLSSKFSFVKTSRRLSQMILLCSIGVKQAITKLNLSKIILKNYSTLMIIYKVRIKFIEIYLILNLIKTNHF